LVITKISSDFQDSSYVKSQEIRFHHNSKIDVMTDLSNLTDCPLCSIEQKPPLLLCCFSIHSLYVDELLDMQH